MRQGRVIKTPENMDDGIGVTDVGQKLVSDALSLTRTFGQSGYVHNLNRGRHDAGRMYQGVDGLKPWVRYRNNADIGFWAAECKGGGLSFGIGNTVEQGGLSRIGQTDDPAS